MNMEQLPLNTMAAGTAHRFAELYWRMSARTPYRFGPLLGLLLPGDGGNLQLDRVHKEGSKVVATVPEWLLLGPGRTLSLGGATALIDEVSTYTGTVAADRRSRPGLSVTLESEWVGPPFGPLGLGAGPPRVVVRTWPLRIGKTLGFLNVDMSCADTGQLLVRARHVKYLPMGLFFDTVFRPAAVPLTLPIAERFWGSGSAPRDEPFELHSMFPWQEKGGQDEDEDDGQLHPHQHPHQLNGQGQGAVGASGGFEREFRPSLLHANPIGGLHGGAACLLSEQAAATGLAIAAQGAAGGVVRGDHVVARKMVATLSSHVNAAKGERVALRSTVNRAAGSEWVSTEVTLSKAATREAAVTTEIVWCQLPPA